MIQSMSIKANYHDNAVAESFFHTIKTELINHEIYHTKDQYLNILKYFRIEKEFIVQIIIYCQ